MSKTPLRRAFTLIEILVVLVIMGFLVSMVAPKLAGVLSWSETPIDDANLRELEKVTASFVTQNERLPRFLLNLIHENNASGTPDYALLSFHESPGEEANLSLELKERLLPTLHVLNAAEAKELKRLGVGKVRNYLHSYNSGAVAYNREIEVAAGVGVMMAGCGADDESANVTWAESLTGSIDDDGLGSISYASGDMPALDDPDPDTYANMDGAPYAGRILMAIDNESELVTRGLLEASGTSPKEARQSEVKLLHYLLVLPRLKATSARMGSAQRMELRKYDEKIETLQGSKTEELNATQRVDTFVIISPQGYANQERIYRYGVKIRQ